MLLLVFVPPVFDLDELLFREPDDLDELLLDEDDDPADNATFLDE